MRRRDRTLRPLLVAVAALLLAGAVSFSGLGTASGGPARYLAADEESIPVQPLVCRTERHLLCYEQELVRRRLDSAFQTAKT